MKWLSDYIELIFPIIALILIAFMFHLVGNMFPDRLCIDGVVHEKFYDEEFTRPTKNICVLQLEDK